MPHHLALRFDPDYDYLNLRPRELADGSVDHRNLGYVQNVRQGELLAEWLPDGTEAAASGQVLECAERVLPAGEGVRPDPANPDRLLADRDGYPSLFEGRIIVKTLLNVRQEVGVRTGNVQFVGDVVVHDAVRSGFQVAGRSVLVKGVVEAALVRAEASLSCEGGVKGAGRAVLKAGENLRLPFAEKAMLLAGKNLLVDGACMHCEIFAGGRAAVKGLLVGGAVYASSVVYVEEQLGGGLGAETLVLLGYDAMALNKAMLVERRIREETKRLEELTALSKVNPALREELKEKIIACQDKLDRFSARNAGLWQGIHARADLERCAVIVPGRVRPGVEVCIGGARLEVDDFLENVRFTYKDGEVTFSSPAM
ncbi:MAG: FapA family protein [Thermodesulfobacteriota bacterium]